MNHAVTTLNDQRLSDHLKWNSYLSERKKLLYVATPKVACTSIKWWFAALEGVSLEILNSRDSNESDPDLVIHDVFGKVAPSVTGLPVESLREALFSDEFFRFAVVRNPYKRIFSAWQSKLLLREPLQAPLYRDKEFYSRPLDSFADVRRSFEAFLQHLMEFEAPQFWDVHWTPQTALLRPDLIPYTAIGKIENLGGLEAALLKHLGKGCVSPFSIRRANESLIPYNPELISEKSAALIQELYEADFSLFDYPIEPPAASGLFSDDQLKVALSGIRMVRGRHQRLDEIRGVLRSRNVVLEQRLAEEAAKVDASAQVVAERETRISELSAALSDQGAKIAALESSKTEQESQISKLSQTIAERDARVAVLVQGLSELESQLTELSREINGRDTKIVGLTQEIVECDARAAGYAETLSDREYRLAAMSSELAERDARVESLGRKTTEYEARIAELALTVVERDSQIVRISESIGEQDSRLGELTDAVTRQSSENSEMKRALSEREARIDELSRVIAERDLQVAQMAQATKALRCEVDALHSSTSWRITGPMRYVSRRLRGANHIAAVAPGSSSRAADRSDERTAVSAETSSGISSAVSHLLPTGFDTEIYLELNPDVRQCGMDAATHYLQHGRFEGRSYRRPGLNVLSSRLGDPDKATVLVVSHDASRTGAPILSLNLVESLSERYNVVVLLLGPGGLDTAFQSAATEVVIDPVIRGNPQLATYVIEEICRRHELLFALVNSIESRVVLRALASHFVPTVSLLHEFASYTRPRHAFRDAFLWSAETVFSARVTMENALGEYPDLSGFSVEVVPQGRCLVPREVIGTELVETERAFIARKMRPLGDKDDSVVILGAGSVQLRKGVELFLECASRVVRAPGGEKCRFVWIGHGYNPDDDIGYSVYLADQLRRARLEDRVVFVRETSEIEVAYQAADVFLLSSRLDPLPNVAIDAMTYALPVVCFDRTTGIADFLSDNGLRDACVAEYLDSYDLARKVLALVESPVFRKSIGERCREASLQSFRMRDYVARLESLALAARERMEQERADGQAILDSDMFRPEFAIPGHLRGISRERAVGLYVRSWTSGIDRRKPVPGFHPGIYRERIDTTLGQSDPFAAFLRAGRPSGPWSYPVITGEVRSQRSTLRRARVALHLHAYFSDLLPEIIARLELNEIRPDLFVSVKGQDAQKSVAESLAQYKGRVAEVRVVPNRGRDIGPFLTAFGEQLVGDYDFVGHLHTKKSLDIKDSGTGAAWYSFLLENLLGGQNGGRMADAAIARMVEDSSIGIVFPDDPHIVGWNENRPFAEPLAERLGLQELPEAFNFPVGTMFWARSSVIAPLVRLGLTWEDYPEEPLPYDGSLLHAMERLFGLVPVLNGTQCAVAHVLGVTR